MRLEGSLGASTIQDIIDRATFLDERHAAPGDVEEAGLSAYQAKLQSIFVTDTTSAEDVIRRLRDDQCAVSAGGDAVDG